jgi:hypothetical protein
MRTVSGSVPSPSSQPPLLDIDVAVQRQTGFPDGATMSGNPGAYYTRQGDGRLVHVPPANLPAKPPAGRRPISWLVAGAVALLVFSLAPPAVTSATTNPLPLARIADAGRIRGIIAAEIDGKVWLAAGSARAYAALDLALRRVLARFTEGHLVRIRVVLATYSAAGLVGIEFDWTRHQVLQSLWRGWNWLTRVGHPRQAYL